jgi:cysteine desulfurase family protein
MSSRASSSRAAATIYLNNAATSFPKPPAVVRAVREALETCVGDPGRGTGRGVSKARRIVLDTRAAVARLFGVREPSCVIFTKNGTEALNIAIKGLVGPGHHVVTTAAEHNSVNRPLAHLERRGVEVTRVPLGADGTVEPYRIEQAVRPNTRLIVVVHISNVLGTANPIAEIGAIARRHQVPLLVDAAQSAGHLPIDVERDQVDLLACPGHKGLFGPQGTGILYVRDGLALATLTEGGTGTQSEVELQPEELPNRFEAGSLNLPGIAGLGAGVRFLLEQGITRIRRYDEGVLRQLVDGLCRLSEVTVHGGAELARAVPIVSVNIADREPLQAAVALDRRGLFVRAGLHCNPGAHRFLGTFPDGSIRLSASYLTDERSVAQAVQIIRTVARRRPAAALAAA